MLIHRSRCPFMSERLHGCKKNHRSTFDLVIEKQEPVHTQASLLLPLTPSQRPLCIQFKPSFVNLLSSTERDPKPRSRARVTSPRPISNPQGAFGKKSFPYLPPIPFQTPFFFRQCPSCTSPTSCIFQSSSVGIAALQATCI